MTGRVAQVERVVNVDEELALPLVLAGPVLRRAEPGRVCVWLATSRPATCSAEVFVLEGEALALVGGGDAREVRLGPRLYVHLAVASPSHPAARAPGPAVPAGPAEPPAFPVGQLLAYDVAVATEGGPARRLGDLGRLEGVGGIAYPGLPLPTFFLADPGGPLRLLHGSCRQLHGQGEDAFLAADHAVAANARDLGARPSALFLTGDQIYGDEVGGPLIAHLGRLGRTLLGPEDDRSVPGVPPLSSLAPYGRRHLATGRACFTSRYGENHLFSLGEFAAAYLTAWDDACWPAALPAFEEAVPGAAAGSGPGRWRQRRRYQAEVEALEAARAALPAVRRVLANVPTYTCFDDHDVTDDWNLTRRWRERVAASPTGRRVVANALAAFWAFQGWGNEPDAYDDRFVAAVTRRACPPASLPAGSGLDELDTADVAELDTAFEAALWSFDRWSYVAPTSPPALVLDTRTQRGFDSDEAPPRLIHGAGLARVRELALRAGIPAAGNAVLVSPVPVFGLELQERRQKLLAGRLGPYEIDAEAWHSALGGLVDLMRLLVEDLGLRRCVVLSGDVHYGFTVDASFEIDGRSLHVAQLVSSALKHSGALARVGLDLLGRTAGPGRARVGWDEAPEFRRAPGLVHRLLERPPNTDEWADGGPAFLPAELAGAVAADCPPRYREARRYLRPEHGPASVVVGENNVGLVTVAGDSVVHVVVGRNGGSDRPHTARIDLAAPVDLGSG